MVVVVMMLFSVNLISINQAVTQFGFLFFSLPMSKLRHLSPACWFMPYSQHMRSRVKHGWRVGGQPGRHGQKKATMWADQQEVL